MQWSGFAGAPGVTTVFSDPAADPNSFISSWKTFFEALKNYLAPPVTISYPSTYDVLDETTGHLTGSGTCTAPGPTSSAVLGAYAAPCGVVALWHTSSILDGHRITGKTYIVPTVGMDESSGGNPVGSLTGTVVSAGTALIAAQANKFWVWHRPRKATALHPARVGATAEVVSVACPSKFVVLTSRRD